MKRSMIIIVLASLLSPAQVFAKGQSGLEELCSSFAGEWTGTCVEKNNGQKETVENQTMSVAQEECRQVNIDHGTGIYVIGGVTEHTVTTAQEWNSMVVSANWTDANTVLKGKINYTSRSLGNGPIISTNTSASFSMKLNGQGQLIAHSDGVTEVLAPWNNEAQTSKYSSHCTYSKK